MKNWISLNKNDLFEQVIKKGRYAAEKKIVVYSLKNGLNINRVGIAISSKMAKSTARNRFRRIIKEWLRIKHSSIIIGYDIVSVARKTKSEKLKAREIFLKDYQDDLIKAFNRLKLIQNEKVNKSGKEND